MENHTTLEAEASASDREGCACSAAELKAFRHAMKALTGRWKAEIMWVLLAGPLRFGEMRRALPDITQHMLTAQLRALEADRLVTRTAYPEIPPRVEYTLTEKAYALKPIFLALVEWSGTSETLART